MLCQDVRCALDYPKKSELVTIILVPGTWGTREVDYSAEWWAPTSPFARMLAGYGHRVLGVGPNERPFVWSTNINGAYLFDRFMDWRAGGAGLYEYAVPSLCPAQRVPPKDLVVIAHSHGLQCVRYAADAGLEIALLVSVMSPIRPDVMARTPAARKHIGYWRHLFTDDSDLWQISGDELFTNALRTSSEADANLFVPEAGHLGVLDDPAYFPSWKAWLV